MKPHIKRIYVAGPMSGLPGLNYPAFNAKTAELRAAGHHVENPAENDPDIDPDKPDARLELQKQRNGDTQHYTQHLWFCKAAQQFATTPRRLPVSYVPYSGDAVYAQQ